MLLILTSTGHRLFSFININDLKQPWVPHREVFVNVLAIFGCNAYFKRELRQND